MATYRGTLLTLCALLAFSSIAEARDGCIDYFGDTDKGMTREKNEDSFVVVENLRLYAVADGMGGHAAGEVASALAVESLKDAYAGDLLSPIWQSNLFLTALNLSRIIHATNLKIYEQSVANPEQRGMGTTLITLQRVRDKVFFSNMGDSRIYRLRDGKLEQVTVDHSLLNAHIEAGLVKTPEEIENFPYKHVMTRAMGTKPSEFSDYYVEDIRKGDLYILCSDGLFDELKDSEIQKILNDNRSDLEKSTKILIRDANASGGRDNITVILVDFDC